MNDKLKKIFEKLDSPPVWAQIIVYILTFIFAISAIIVSIIGFEQPVISIIAYCLFALAALSLAYSVYLIVKRIPTIKNRIKEYIYKFEFSRTLAQNYGFRTIAFSLVSFVLSILFGAFNLFLSIKFHSIWYGALSAFYVFLAFLRGGILLYHKNKNNAYGKKESALMQAKAYRNCGIILLVLNLALSSAIAQMIFDDMFFMYYGWTIYAFAAYAFYKIAMSIINVFKARNHSDMTVLAVRNVNLIDATVSILALQTALLHTFVTDQTDVSLFNTLTGCAVTIVTITIGILMIIKATKVIKNIQSEKTNG